MADEPLEQTYPVSGQQLWDALQAVIAELNYEVNDVSPQQGTIAFRTRLSFWSWRGQNMVATVRELAPQSAQLSLTGDLALKVQVTSWGERKRIARKVFERVGRRLGAPAPA